MTSRYSGDIFYGGGGGSGSSRTSLTGIGSAVSPYGVRQQPQQPQQGYFGNNDQIASRRSAELLMGKRSFGDYNNNNNQTYQQQIFLQQQQQQPLSFIHQQYLMRSVRQRTNQDFSSSPRFGLPVYQQQQLTVPISSYDLKNNINNPLLFHSGNNPVQTGPGFGLSNPIRIKPDDDKILNTLHELEKQLLNDDDDDEDEDRDAVSVITNSEWSETFQNLMGSDPNSNNPAQVSPMGSVSTSGSNHTIITNNNNNNLLISPSPTSSTSSCCSTSASPGTVLPVPAKQLISEAATAISDGKNETAMEALTRLAQMANPKGSSEQRLAFYMGHALRSRACPSENPSLVNELYGKDQMSAMYTMYDLSPCFKFGLLAANLVMLEAIACSLQQSLRIHVIDFHVGHHGQYVNLLRALAERCSQGTKCNRIDLKITVVDTELDVMGSMSTTESVKDELVKLAERVGINLRFESVTRKIHELTRESLGCEDGEAVVVNFAFMLFRVPDESVSMENLRDELLRRVKSLGPRAVTLVEQDMNANTAPFKTRVNEAYGYYGALFDSFESTHPRENPDRARVEEGLGRKMANVIACEGRERVERAEVFGKWRARMGMAGFDMKPLSQSVAESMRAKLNSGRSGNPGFTVKEEGGGVGFGWMGRTLTVASAWR